MAHVLRTDSFEIDDRTSAIDNCTLSSLLIGRGLWIPYLTVVVKESGKSRDMSIPKYSYSYDLTLITFIQ